ncbi:hypothetical protein GCK72_022371 [Caenorhabditis remanei]|uniref:Uncharacterized protein n=1 Tax=Caenorhabditis remanei TaxID=31234 RepID=A0A6A5FTN6_CAERE|nr:hypothetical protein GCK72_022371 [Caenorhabditis remanei]KAF1745924.1 hypothetical protein GCK72_022371 [Caenorhabditis remanei]
MTATANSGNTRKVTFILVVESAQDSNGSSVSIRYQEPNRSTREEIEWEFNDKAIIAILVFIAVSLVISFIITFNSVD